MRILWLDRAEADLDEAFDYVLARDPGAARRLFDAIRNRVALLAEQPALGRPGRVAGTRELVIGGTPYVVAYAIDHAIDAVVILRVLHGARRWPDTL
jgi:toxin ParE1/3/4